MQIETSPTSYGCIYKITNKLNNKCNIGQTTDINTRLYKYKHLNCKRQPKLYNALKKYGVDNFTFETIAEAATKCQLNELEQYYIKQYNSINNGYNCMTGGSFGKHSPESKAKMSLAHIGNTYALGYKHPDEVKERMSETRKGLNNNMFNKNHSAESRRKMSERLSGVNSPNFGRKQTPETITKRIQSYKESIAKKKSQSFSSASSSLSSSNSSSTGHS